MKIVMVNKTENKRNVSLTDFYQFELPSHPVVSPDGKLVIYEKTKVREINNDYETHLWLADIYGKSKNIITTKGTQNKSAIWSPDGTSIAFLSNRSNGNQIWIHSFKSEETKKLTNFKGNMSSIAFTSDGQKLITLLPVKDNIVEIEDLEIDYKPRKRSYESLYYKFDGIGFHDGSKQQLVVIDIETQVHQKLTDGSLNIEEFTVSPDGKEIAFVVIDNEYSNPMSNGALYKLNMSSNEVTKLYDQQTVSKPTYSPDAKGIAYIAGGIHQRLYVISSNGEDVKCVSNDYQDSLTDSIYTDVLYHRSSWKPRWSNDNKFIYVLSSHQGSIEVVQFSIDQNEQPVSVISGKRAIFDFSYDGSTSIITTYTSPTTPGRVSEINVSKNPTITRAKRDPMEDLSKESSFFPYQETIIDDGNTDYLSSVNIAELETFTYNSTDNWKIHGFLLKPNNMNQDKKYPVVLDIHGGPHSTHGFAYFHQMQLLSAQGYVVVYVNPRGSLGYGETFTDAVTNDYGGKDKIDILNGLDEALGRYNFLDETRVAISGLSYGGFMTNWIITQTDRFSAAISEGSVCNWVSIYGTGDVDPGMTDEDLPDKNSFEALWEISPLAYVKKINTPILLIHAEDDHRVPIGQGEQFYSYIKRQAKDARFVRIPESSHMMLQIGDPDKRSARLEEMIDWLKRYL